MTDRAGRALTVHQRESRLSLHEFGRVSQIAFGLGVRSVQLTGDEEPLLRRGVERLVAKLHALGFVDIAMTTSGMSLARQAPALAGAGLDRVNVNCDSLRPERFAAAGGRGDLHTVLDAMDAAEQVGLLPVKVNVVLVAGRNDDEILDFARFARATGRAVRFIEAMPLGGRGDRSSDEIVPGARVIEEINAEFPLRPDPDRGRASSEEFCFADGSPGAIGILRNVTQPICGSCNRLRVTAEGKVRNCLFSDEALPLIPALRRGTDDDVALVLRRAAWGEHAVIGCDDPQPVVLDPAPSISMSGS